MDEACDNSFEDSFQVDPSEALNYGVLIHVPLIYTETDEMNGTDVIVPQIRVINFPTLIKLMEMAEDIPSAIKDAQIDKCSQFVTLLTSDPRMTNDKESSQKLNSLMTLIQTFTSVSKQLDVDEVYVDIGTKGLSFDRLHMYNLDSNSGLLISTEEVEFEGKRLYSQFKDSKDMERVAKILHDSPYNRIQRQLKFFEQTLIFTPGYLYNSTVQWLNLSLLYMCLYQSSYPIKNRCRTDLKCNMLGYIVDLIVRSKAVHHWQRNHNSRQLLKDLKANYKLQYWVELVQLETAKQRAHFFLAKLKDSRNGYELAKAINYEAYENYLNNIDRVTVDGRQYYIFNSSFVTQIIKLMPTHQAFDSIVASMNEFNEVNQFLSQTNGVTTSGGE